MKKMFFACLFVGLLPALLSAVPPCYDGDPCTEDIDLGGGLCDHPPVVCDDGNDCTDDSCDSVLGCQYDPLAEFTPCGDQNDTICDAPDTCDGAGNCQTNYEPVTTLCRDAVGLCDEAENCLGNGECAVDEVFGELTLCRASQGDCDPAEYCDGMNKDCPADIISGDDTVCAPAAGVCDAVEYCDGTHVDCPFDLKQTIECNAKVGDCDVAENCDGIEDTCPIDGVAGDTVVCRDVLEADVCDAVEKCTGSSKDCPGDGVKGSDVVCRPVAGVCDVADNCDGTNKGCPTDAFAADTVPCRPAAGDCDIAENCSGDAATCPANEFVAIDTPCGDSTDTLCNNADSCDGNGACLDNFEPDTTVCIASTGACDPAEYCDGTGNCPLDLIATDETVCRPSVGDCDVAEYCDGSTVLCPAEDYTTVNGDACVDGYDYTDNETCANGECLGTEVIGSCTDAYAATTFPYVLESTTIGRPSHLTDYGNNCPATNAPLGDAVVHVDMQGGVEYTISIVRHGGWTGFIAIIPICSAFFTNATCLNTGGDTDSFTYTPLLGGNATLVIESLSGTGDFTLTVEEYEEPQPDDILPDDDTILTDEMVTDDIVTDDVATDDVVTDDVVTDDIATDDIVTDDVVTDEAVSDDGTVLTDESEPFADDVVYPDDAPVATDDGAVTQDADTTITDNETPDEATDMLIGDEDEIIPDTAVVDTDKPGDDGCGCTVVF